MEIFVNIPVMNGKTLALSVQPSYTVQQIKHIIEQVEGLCPIQQQLIFCGKRLSNEHVLRDYNIEMDSMLYLIIRLKHVKVQFIIGGQNVSLLTVMINNSGTIEDLKAAVYDKTGIHPEEQQLFTCRVAQHFQRGNLVIHVHCLLNPHFTISCYIRRLAEIRLATTNISI